MKTRSDFVTNSSSSSFVAYGVSIDKLPSITNEVIVEHFEKVLTKYRKWSKANPFYGDYNGVPYYEGRVKEMESLATDEAIVEYMEDQMDDELYDLTDEYYNKGVFSVYRSEDDTYVAVDLWTVLTSDFFKDLAVKDVLATITDQFNATFGTSFTPDDVEHYDYVLYG